MSSIQTLHNEKARIATKNWLERHTVTYGQKMEPSRFGSGNFKRSAEHRTVRKWQSQSFLYYLQEVAKALEIPLSRIFEYEEL